MQGGADDLRNELPRQVAAIALEMNAVCVKYGFWEVLTALLMNLDLLLRYAVEGNPHCGEGIQRASAEFRGHSSRLKEELWRELLTKQARVQ